MLRVEILGPLVVRDQGRDVTVGGARLRALVTRLALEPGRTVTAGALAEALWPDDGPKDPAHALQALVSRLRRVLPDGLRSVPGGYVLDADVDAPEFERLARDGGRALRADDAESAAALLDAALALWRGDALADTSGLAFADAAAVRLEGLRVTAAEDRVAAGLAVGADPARAVPELEALAARHPLRERPRTLLVEALHRAGRSAEALEVFERFRGVLVAELGTDPGAELQDAYLAVLRSVPVRQPRGNLRVPPTSFVGRDAERAWIARRLWDGRLVTLVGPGGAGKTRLATQAAADLSGRFPGGVWLVELAAVREPGDVTRAVSAVLGVRDAGGLAEALSTDATLIVLDNCEHVVDAAARLADELLGACPSLRVLATSRERLGVDGEALCPVPPLDPAASAALFGERAAAVRPGLAVDAAEAAEICRRLDGLPLAIELAAARLRSMSAAQLAVRLDDRFRVLTGGNRTAKHRTLRDVVAWSWDLLDDAERRFAERLAVFPGTIGPDAAARVTGVPEALDLLDALVDRSLLQAVDGAEPRFRMLETIREYGRERLAENGELDRVRAAHVACFLELAERAEPQLRAAGQLEWLGLLDAERDNLHAALQTAVDAGDAASAVRLGAALGTFWMMQGDHVEAARRLRQALRVPRGAPVPAEAEAAALGGYVFNVVLSGVDVRDDPLVSAARPDAAHPLAALTEPAAALLAGDPAGGVAAVDRRLPEPDPWARAALYLVRAMLNGNRGEPAEFRADLAAAEAGFREAGERAGLALALVFAAETRTVTGEFDAAVAALEESIGLLDELGQGAGAGMQRVMLATARARAGDVRRARDELTAMIAPGAATPARFLVPVRLALGDLARQSGDVAVARAHYAAAEDELARVPSFLQHRSLLETAYGQLGITRDDPEAARRHLRRAFTLAVDAPDMPVAAVAGFALARLRAAADPDAAAQVLGAASVLRGAPDAFNPDVALVTRALRRTLGERAFHAAYDRAGRLDIQGALALLDDQLRRR